MQEIISQAFILYYEGLIETDVTHAFLKLWTALEIITFKKRDNIYDEIKRRLKSIYPVLEPVKSYEIDRLFWLRHNLVHEGGYNISQIYRNSLKGYVENMLKFVLFELNKFTMDEIQTIFYFLGKEHVYLEGDKKLLDFVLELKANTRNRN